MSFSALVLSKIKYLSSHQRLHQSNKLMSKKKEEKRRKKKGQSSIKKNTFAKKIFFIMVLNQSFEKDEEVESIECLFFKYGI